MTQPAPSLAKGAALAFLGAALCSLADAQELFPDGCMDSLGGWTPFPDDADASHTTEVAGTDEGCLFLERYRTAH